ncbi:MAG: hypothetical protein QXD73_02715, partial [Candidatus Bathyarchaeia archaeon]
LESAIRYLVNSITSLKSMNAEAFSNSVWRVAAELEYALFLFSLTIENGQEALLKLNPEPRNLQLDKILLGVKDLIRGAQEYFKNGDLLNAFRNVRLARHYIFYVQNILAKRGRKGTEER